MNPPSNEAFDNLVRSMAVLVGPSDPDLNALWAVVNGREYDVGLWSALWDRYVELGQEHTFSASAARIGLARAQCLCDFASAFRILADLV